MPLKQSGSNRLLAVVAVTCILLSGCGFQLRGATAVPDALEPLFVDCAGNTPPALCEEVRDLLALNQVTLAETASEEAYVLRIRDVRTSQRATAITASAGAAEYNLRLSATMSLFGPPGDVPLLVQTSLAASEVYRYDDTNVLAQRREQQTLTQLLHRQLAQQIVYRLTPFTAEQIQRRRGEHQSQQQPQEDARQSEASPAAPTD